MFHLFYHLFTSTTFNKNLIFATAFTFLVLVKKTLLIILQ